MRTDSVRPEISEADLELLEMSPEADAFFTLLVRAGRNKGPEIFLDAWMNDEISLGVMRELILDVWSAAELPRRCLDDETWLGLFDKAGFVTDCGWVPPMPMRVFRGAPLHKPRGFSWSWEMSVARSFGQRYQRAFGVPCGIFSIEVREENLLGLIAKQRKEGEVIVNPQTLRGNMEPTLEEEITLEDGEQYGSVYLS